MSYVKIATLDFSKCTQNTRIFLKYINNKNLEEFGILYNSNDKNIEEIDILRHMTSSIYLSQDGNKYELFIDADEKIEIVEVIIPIYAKNKVMFNWVNEVVTDLPSTVESSKEGRHLITTNEKEQAFGKYNESNTGTNSSDKTAYSIGGGSSESDRKNLFEIMEDGTIYILKGGVRQSVQELTNAPVIDAYTKTEVDNKLSTKSNISHHHDAVYRKITDSYTKIETLGFIDRTIVRPMYVSNTDLNTLNTVATTGFGFSGGDNNTNTPIEGWFTLETTRASGSIHIQTIYNDTQMFRRYCNIKTNTWSEWKGLDELHNHDSVYRKITDSYTKIETDDLLDNKSDTTHNHDSVYAKKEDIPEGADLSPYYKKTEVDGLLNGKSDSDHDHDLIYPQSNMVYSKTEVDTKLGTKSNTSHTHDSVYRKITDSYSKTEADDIVLSLTSEIGKRAPADHDHDDLYYTQSQVTTALGTKSDTTHTHDGTYRKITDSYSKTQTDTLLNDKATVVHDHDSVYRKITDSYTKTEIDGMMTTSSNFVSKAGDTMSGQLELPSVSVAGKSAFYYDDTIEALKISMGDSGSENSNGTPTVQINPEQAVTFTEAGARVNILSGDPMKIIFGKIKKYFTDIKPHAFTDPDSTLNLSSDSISLSAYAGKLLNSAINRLRIDLSEETISRTRIHRYFEKRKNFDGFTGSVEWEVIRQGNVVSIRIAANHNLAAANTQYNLSEIKIPPGYRPHRYIYEDQQCLVSGSLSGSGMYVFTPFGSTLYIGSIVDYRERHLNTTWHCIEPEPDVIDTVPSLFPKTASGWVVGTLVAETGENLESSARLRTDFIPLEDNTNGQVYSVTNNKSTATNCQLVVYCYDENKQFLASDSFAAWKWYSFLNFSSNVKYVKLVVRLSNDATITTSAITDKTISYVISKVDNADYTGWSQSK